MPTLLDRGKLVGDGLADVVPIEYIMQWIRDRVHLRGIANRVMILKAETASGKSTVLPSFLYNVKPERHGMSEDQLANTANMRGMIVTQPRVVTAKENVNEIKKWNKQYTQRDIGHSTKYDKMRPARTGILSATIGTLTTELNTSTDEQILSRYQYIIIDEAHERSIQLDLTLMALYNLLKRTENRDDCPFVILCSATFDQRIFMNFFGVGEENFIWCRGAPQPIDERWDFMGDHTTSNYLKTITDIVAEITEKDVPRDDTHSPSSHDGSAFGSITGSDIIVFVPGKAEMLALRALLEPLRVGILRKDITAGFDIITLERADVNSYSADYQRLFNPIADTKIMIGDAKYTPRRRVILATNVAETGLTLGDLKYVIDSGYARETEYIPSVNAAGLLTHPAPQSRVWQRRGRAGRNAPGVFYPTYPKHIYDRLPLLQHPDIITNSCIDMVLMTMIAEQYKNLGIDYDDERTELPPIDLNSIHLVQQPMAESITNAIHILIQCGFATSKDGKTVHLTPMGRRALKLNEIPPDYVRAIFAGYYWDIQPYDLIVGSAFTQTYTIKLDKINWCAVYRHAEVSSADDSDATCYRLRLLMCDSMIDGIVLYRALRNVGASGHSISQWCNDNGIVYDQVTAFSERVDDMVNMFVLANMRVFTDVKPLLDDLTADTVARFKHCIYDGFAHNLIVQDGGPRKYRQVGWSRRQVMIPPMLAEKGANLAAAESLGVKLAALPKYVVCIRFNIQNDDRTGTVNIAASAISVMDGYCSVCL